jgi:hypothetical protein
MVRKLWINAGGYLLFQYHPLGNGYANKSLLVHRIVATVFIPNPDNKPEVNHIDCDPTNNRVENLEWCTSSENTRHSWKLGRQNDVAGRLGEDHQKAKLTTVQAINIIHVKGSITAAALARLYGVRATTVLRIWSGEGWNHLPRRR